MIEIDSIKCGNAGNKTQLRIYTKKKTILYMNGVPFQSIWEGKRI